MKTQMHLVMPMGGRGYRFFKDGFVVPKPLIMLNDKPFLYWSTQSVIKFVDVKDITFVILKEHIDSFHIDTEIRKYYPEANIVVIPRVLEGAVLTCMEGISAIQDDCPILFNDCDHMFVSEEFNSFCNSGEFDSLDGAVLTFESDEPKYSFLKYDDSGNVAFTVEKTAVSTHAICGAYFFRNKKFFVESAEKYLEECNYDEFFVSGLYNIMIREGYTVKGFQTDIHIPFGIPEEFYCAERDQRIRMVE